MVTKRGIPAARSMVKDSNQVAGTQIKQRTRERKTTIIFQRRTTATTTTTGTSLKTSKVAKRKSYASLEKIKEAFEMERQRITAHRTQLENLDFTNGYIKPFVYSNLTCVLNVVSQLSKELLVLERNFTMVLKAIEKLSKCSPSVSGPSSSASTLTASLDSPFPNLPNNCHQQQPDITAPSTAATAPTAGLIRTISTSGKGPTLTESVNEKGKESTEAMKASQTTEKQLDLITKNMREIDAKRKEYEREKNEVIKDLERKQDNLKAAIKPSEKKSLLEHITNLESKIRELEKKCELQNVLYEELQLELASRKKLDRQQWINQRSYSSEGVGGGGGGGGSTTSDRRSQYHRSQSTTSEPDEFSLMSASETRGSETRKTSFTSQLPSDSYSTKFMDESERNLKESTTGPLRGGHISMSDSSYMGNEKRKDIDQILARLEQDNKTLAELERSRHTIGSPISSINLERMVEQRLRATDTSDLLLKDLVPSTSSLDNDLNQINLKSSFSSPAINELLGEESYTLNPFTLTTSATYASTTNQSVFTKSLLHSHTNNPDKQSSSRLKSHTKSSSFSPSLTLKDLDKLMAKLEQDNRILAELDRKVKRVASNNAATHSSAFLSSSLPSLSASHYGRSSSAMNYSQLQGLMPGNLSAGYASYGGLHTSLHQPPLGLHSHPQRAEEIRHAEDIVDSIEIPNRGRCKVFIARYSYDPFKQSPNENPEQELHLNAGDFVLIFGDMDEDGFFMGELLDGRRGLVPSNFVEKLTGEDLFEFQASVLYGGRDGDESNASYPPEFYDAILNDAMGHTNFQHLLAPEDFHRMNDYVDLTDSNDFDEEDLSDVERAQAAAARDPIPPPKRLILERQLHKSILIGWLHPDCPKGMIDCYQIYVDGVLKASVPSNERTKALVEGVDSSMPHRISVRAVTAQGRMSKDAACTIVIGKNVPFAPCCVKATSITSESALISWLPCNSNFYHVVAVNSVEVRTVGPSVYKHLITGLAANTLYRVSVRAKPGKLLCSDEKNPKKLEMLTTFVDFRTLPKSLPEPPVDVQVESGPQEGTLLVTWLPVTLDQFGTSNGCPVTGYAVFAAHKKLAEIDSPTGDHALLDISQVESFHKKAVTVRTKSGENLSADSMPCQIPDDLLKFTTYRKLQSTNFRTTKQHPHQQQMSRQLMQQQRMQGMNRNIQNRQHQLQQHPQQHGYHGHPDDGMVDTTHRMTIPAIEITKDTPSESINPLESYSEEEYEAMLKNRGTRFGTSPVPPHRNRQLTEYERTNYGTTADQQRGRPMQRGVRWFVALYDYDPLTMSPNPDAADEELPFREGDMIKIHGDKDADGFYRGELNGRFGFVPCNMVSEVQYDSEMGGSMRQHGGQDPWAHLPVKKMIALYDYDPQELSPNPDAEMELAFNTGDIIYVYGEMDEDGFYMGEINGVRGLVPSNFLTEVASNEGTTRHGVKQGQRGRVDPRMQQQLQHQQMQQQQQHPALGPIMGQDIGQHPHQYTHHPSQMNQQMSMGRGMGMRQPGPMTQQQIQQQNMMAGSKRPNTLDLGGNSPRFPNQVNHNNNQQAQQQQQQTSLNPFSSLFASGKKILEEATTPRAPQPPPAQVAGGPGFNMGGQQQGYANAQMPRPGQQPQQFHHPQQQPQHHQQQYSQQQFPQQQQQQQPFGQQQHQQQFGQQQQQQPAAGALTGALGAMKNIFKL